MNKIPNPFRGMKRSSILTIVACLSVCGFSVYQALDGQSFSTTTTSVAAESSRSQRPADSIRSAIAEAGSPILTRAAASPSSQIELTKIEELTVGRRVQADSPTTELDLQFGSDVVSADWRKLTLVAPKRDGSTADVVLLRPLTWLNEQQAEVGGTVFISVPECGIDGHAQVLAIEPCPEIVPGEGRVITGTFRHQVSASISLSILGQAEPILCTGNHPFWSEDRQDFVRADSLQPRETLRTTSGTTTVTSLNHIPGSTAVYNLEIHGTHVYHVGTSGVLVHNGDPCPLAEALLNPLLKLRDILVGNVEDFVPTQVLSGLDDFALVDDIAATMTAQKGWGNIPPILIHTGKDGMKTIVDGHHRLEAARAAGIEIRWMEATLEELKRIWRW
ncbi:MAG: ParB/RepB/Spo0J family partition protein [Planctomycetaceae bacterium]